MREPIGKITPHRIVQLQTVPGQPLAMTGRVKAAVIVRLLLAEGSPLPLSSLPEHMQAALTEQIGRMRLVDRTTLGAVVEEFLNELEQVGLSFPGGIEGALSMMDGHISTTAANRLRRLASASGKADPWDRIIVLDEDRLLPVLEAESEEVAAVMLSKLPIPRAASLLGRLPGDFSFRWRGREFHVPLASSIVRPQQASSDSPHGTQRTALNRGRGVVKCRDTCELKSRHARVKTRAGRGNTRWTTTTTTGTTHTGGSPAHASGDKRIKNTKLGAGR